MDFHDMQLEVALTGERPEPVDHAVTGQAA
jgi:hypothetical protein